ncbi:hypothetical protein BBO99_00004334 [Phytophthora kernoviae]|uniref:EF-hand domain-containing protein n=2 Tax=Phytophthora kernoviae TaxID=325452 RepID=A0A3R7KUZ0_9STRA|nr:hypothetical protein G195_003100 [Phytophthora kernoviae 00238/432]KAG2526037.1 hypothetical protein JM16_002497 [Phytophthora kernoviae]KAG2527716.1 hypothetical protein JM18_002305 [Phytophthora kernoviae]RLN10967.1 hypothetical protein BBI17_000764 [Phytophthora kernoviae]RLN80644.1 hypothetical protein BBO99_00004334 [Phytophthora kernoviae]
MKLPNKQKQWSGEQSREKTVAKNTTDAQTHGNKIHIALEAVTEEKIPSDPAKDPIEGKKNKKPASTDSKASKPILPKRGSNAEEKLAESLPETTDPTENVNDNVDYRKVESNGLYNILVQTRRCEELCSGLGLTMKDIRKLKRKYNDNDMYHSGEINQAEFFFMIKEEQRPLTQGIFRLADVAVNQKFLSFDEYLLCVVTFATFTKPELYEHVFDLYDADQSGALDESECAKMSLELQSKQFNYPANVATAIRLLEGKDGLAAFAPDDGLVDLDQFMKFARNFPVAFFPIINMQKNIRAATLGESRWSRITANKLKVHELVSYMRRHHGDVPDLSFCEITASIFSNEIFSIRKRAVEFYALEIARRRHVDAEVTED